MGTLSGAEALRLADYCGSITPGKSGRLAIVPLADGKQSPIEAILFSEQKCQPVSAAS
jgi:cytosine/adenosine deaminase-related metal-dependent hydrolase